MSRSKYTSNHTSDKVSSANLADQEECTMENITFNELYNLLIEKTKRKRKSKIRLKCQAKAKAKYDVWPSAYASGYVQRCVKRGGKIN